MCEATEKKSDAERFHFLSPEPALEHSDESLA